MFGLNRWMGLMWPLLETPGESGGGGGGWPDYETPAGVGEAAGGEPHHEPAAAAVPAAGQPAAVAGERPASGQPAGQPAARQGLPQYRLDQIADRESQERIEKAVTDRLKAILGPALGLGDAPAVDPNAQRVRDNLFRLVPELKDLVEKLAPKSAAILGLAEQAPRWEEQNRGYWGGVAGRTAANLHDGVAKLLLGEGKVAKDLDPEMADEVRDIFVRWVESDKTGARINRYEAQDGGLVSDFLKGFAARYIDPARRLAAVAVTARGQTVARLPVAGAGGQPPAAVPPKVDLNDEDAVHGRGFAVMQQLRGQ